MQDQKKDFLEWMKQKCRWLKQSNSDHINGLIMLCINAQPDVIEKSFPEDYFSEQVTNNYKDRATIERNLTLEQPESPWPYLYHGLIDLMRDFQSPDEYLSVKSIENALAYLNTAVIADRKNPIAHYARAIARFHYGDIAGALEDAKTAYANKEAYKTTIKYDKFVEFLENELNKDDFIKCFINEEVSLKKVYEQKKGIAPDKAWIGIDWGHRLYIRPGDLLRQYVSPYICPDEIFFEEYEVLLEPHIRVSHIHLHGFVIQESIGFKSGKFTKTHYLFEHEIWIKREGLTGWDEKLSFSEMPAFLDIKSFGRA